MKVTVWNYLELMYDDATWPDTDPTACIDEVWEDRYSGLQDLMLAQDEVITAAGEGSLAGSAIAEEGQDHPSVMVMVFAPKIMRSVLSSGIEAVRAECWEKLLDDFEKSRGELQAAIALTIASTEIHNTDSRVERLMIEALENDSDDVLRRTKSYLLQGLGQARAVSEDVVRAVARLAGDRQQSQPIRSYALEALMDMGPAAASATEVLDDIMANEDDEDLKMFAWSALKSVTAPSREHPEGGTVADHLRELYTTEDDE